jgi:hypothetical protein
MGTLHYREDEGAFYLHIVIKKEVEERDGDKVLGVDLNLKNVAVTSTGSFYDGGCCGDRTTTSACVEAFSTKALVPPSRYSGDCRGEKPASC